MESYRILSIQPILLALATAFLVPSALLRADTPAEDPSAQRARSAAGADRSFNYLLGPDDSIHVWARDAEELSDKTFTIEQNGAVSLPMIGRIQAAGLTVQQLEAAVTQQLKKYIREPQVTVNVNDFRSQSVSILGAVVSPGIRQLRGPTRLLEGITMAGGLRPDAGLYAKITRSLAYGRLNLPNATEDTAGGTSTAEVDVRALIDSENAVENILLMPKDVVVIPQSELVYILGEVAKQGSYAFADRESLSVLQAISMAGGVTVQAATGKARILRPVLGGPKRAEMPIDIAAMLGGKASDLPLLPNDILVIPSNSAKKVSQRATELAIQMGTWMLTWGLLR